MKKNTYIYVNHKLEITTKTMFKGKNVGTLYCILGEQIFVKQGLSIIEVGMEQLAEGLGIDLFEAQKILAGDYRETSSALEEEMEGLKEALETPLPNPKDDLTKALLGEKEKFIDKKEDVKELLNGGKETVTDKVTDVLDGAPSLPALNADLKKRVDQLELLVDALYLQLVIDKEEILNPKNDTESPVESVELVEEVVTDPQE